MTSPPFWYTITWMGLSCWYFAYWDKYPQFSVLFRWAGSGFLLLSLLHGLGVVKDF